MTPEHLNQHLRKTLSRGRVAASAPAGCPDLPLYLFDPSVLEGPLSHDEAQAVVAEPAYWSFVASGQVLASWILQHPELVAGKAVLDFGSGSGVVAVAAARAGAARAIACDIDPAALDAAAANARLNGVQVDGDDWAARPNPWTWSPRPMCSMTLTTGRCWRRSGRQQAGFCWQIRGFGISVTRPISCKR